MKKIRRSFGSGNRLEQHLEEAPPLDLSKDVAENMRELLNEITKKDIMSTAKRMGYLNNFTQFVRSVPQTSDFGLKLDDIVACLRVALVSSAKEVRAAGFRAFRHFLYDENTLTVLLNQRIDIFIAKSLDLPPTQEVERVQALRLVRKMIHVCPMKFPLSVAMVLAAISVDTSHDKDRLSRACLATLCELAVQNIEIASYSGVVGAIVINTLDCTTPRMNEALLSTILYLYNHPKSRKYVRRRVGLEPVLAPFTDLYYTHSSDLSDSQIKEDRVIRIESAKLALVAIIRSWPGLISLCDPDENSIASLLGVFALPNVQIRDAIIDTLFVIFLLRQPLATDDFSIALQSVDPSAMQENWKLTDQFLVAEGDAVLPHRAHSTRANLIESYLSLLLTVFLEAGILASLVKVITTSDDNICIRGSILLGEILHMANVLLPPSHSVQTHCLPLLMSLATNLEKPEIERGKASAVIGYLDQIHKMKKRGAVPNTLIMEQLISQVESHTKQLKGRQAEKTAQYVYKELDELVTAIRETGILAVGMQETEFESWNWDLISTVLESGKMSLKRTDDPMYNRFIKRLATFYKPFQKLYSSVKLADPMARKYSEVALQLVDFLIREDEQPEGERYLVEILQDVRDCLGEATQPGRLNGIFSTENLSETLTRDYFLLIGRLSSTSDGLRILDKTPGMFQYLMEICSMGSRESLIKLIISCLDYGRDGIARILLTKTLSAAPLTARLYATKFLRVLLRAGCPYFRIWGIELLTVQLCDQEMEVVAEAIEILEEACEVEGNLQQLMEVRPLLLHLGEKGIRLLSRYVSLNKGFTYLREMDYLNVLIQAWKTTYNKEYVAWMELDISEALSTYERQSAQGAYIRRSNNKFIKRKDVYVLPHIYGELVKHMDGIELLQDENIIWDTMDIIVAQRTETSEDLLQLKAALWAMGHILSSRAGIKEVLSYKLPPYPSSESGDGSSCTLSEGGGSDDEEVTGSKEKEEEKTEVGRIENGFETFENGFHDDFRESVTCDDGVDEDEYDEENEPTIIDVIVNLASNSPVLSVRGTCFYVLGLIGSTSIGAERLEAFGWDSVRHKCSEEWPVTEPDFTYFFDSDLSEDEEENGDGIDEVDNTTTQNVTTDLTHQKFGGIYMGEDDIAEESSADQGTGFFEYTMVVYGDDKGKKHKKGKQTPVSDESRYFQIMSSMHTPEPESNITTKFFDIDSWGNMYEKHDDLLAGLDRLNHNSPRITSMNSMDAGGIYLGDDTPSTASEAFESFEDFAPYLSRKNRQSFSSAPQFQDPVISCDRTIPLFDQAGIYLGEVADEHDDTIEANMSPLKPIREEKSQESLDMKSVNVSMGDSKDEDELAISNDISPQERNSMQSLMTSHDLSMNDSRLRSISLTDESGHVIVDSRSPRSSSFSGTMQNRFLNRTTFHPRSGSDPGLGIIPSSLAGSMSSQESDNSRNDNHNGSKKNSSKKLGNRKKSRSETSDNMDHVRSNSVLSDSGSVSGIKLRITKRARVGSTVSLGVSPKSRRGSITPLDSPGTYGYTAWQTLKKERSFKKELDLNLRRHLAASDKRRFGRGFANQYRRMVENSNNLRRSSVPVLTRKQLSSSFALNCDKMTETYIAPHEDYIGRALPRCPPDIFTVKNYSFIGSWADNFVDFAETNNLSTFDKQYRHYKSKCLYCRTKFGPFEENKPRSESDLSVQSKSRSSSKEDATHDEDSESSGRDELSDKMKMNVKKDVLRLVANLSSAVASKSTQQEIITLHGRHQWAFRDLCLYSQVVEVLGMFTFRITIRRFIQKLFEGVDYHVIFEMADDILGRPSNYSDK